MREKRLVAKELAGRSRRARKKEKGRMLDELVALTGYNRWYEVRLKDRQALLGHKSASVTTDYSAAEIVRPFVKSNKTDAIDAQAITIGRGEVELRLS